MPSHEAVAAKLDEIEAELRHIGWWEIERPPPEAFESRTAFFMDTMAYAQWLRYVFVPNVRRIVAGRGDFPDESWVGAQAVREFDGDPHAIRLTTLLSEFDDLFEGDDR